MLALGAGRLRRAVARLQPDSGLPADGGRIARAVAWRITGDRGRRPLLGPARPGLRGADDRLRPLPAARRRHLGAVDVHARLAARLPPPARRSSRAPSPPARGDHRRRPDRPRAGHHSRRPAGRPGLRGLLLPLPGLGVVRSSSRTVASSAAPAASRCARSPRAAGRPPVRDLVVAPGAEGQVPADAPLEALFGSEPLRCLGALMAVDREGRLRGVVTLEQVSRALQGHLAALTTDRIWGPTPVERLLRGLT